ncbi:MAG: 1-deoxy-D-xylulose-5-phosphate reductoisomerase [Acidiferrobacterales bacterium]
MSQTRGGECKPRGVAILGATGSIGVNTLDVISRHPDRFKAVILTANTQIDRLFEQCKQFQPRMAIMADLQSAERLQQRVNDAGLEIEVAAGIDSIGPAIKSNDIGIVMAAIVGAVGLKPTLAAVQAGKQVLIANKEPLVMCGDIFIAEAKRSGAMLLPIDSEHNAVFQCMPSAYQMGEPAVGVRRILLTCSGGPFRKVPVERLKDVTPEQACAHPTWDMGQKISVDSATLMNKGLEVIEACGLFGVPPDRVEVVIHPQSVIHSMVEYLDGSVLSQMGNPDMRIPITHALSWPDRIESGAEALDLIEIGRLDFERPDMAKFPCLRFAYEAAIEGGTAPAILNAANEVTVQAFLDKHIAFTDIAEIIDQVMQNTSTNAATTIDAIIEDDVRARLAARALILPVDEIRRNKH